MSERKIDVYNHVMPRAVADRIRELAPGKGDMVKRVTSIPMLYDIEARIRMMDRWPAYQQVLTLSNPPIETIAGPGDTPELARVANDELKKICETRPDKFPAWVASLPLNNVEASLEEIDLDPALSLCGHAGSRSSPTSTADRSTILSFSRSSSMRRATTRFRYGCIRRATRGRPTTLARRSPNTRSGRSWAGPTRQASQCRASSSPACSTACPR